VQNRVPSISQPCSTAGTVVSTGDEELDESKCLFQLSFSLGLAFRVTMSTRMISEMT
jgi:hypothetical protein